MAPDNEKENRRSDQNGKTGEKTTRMHNAPTIGPVEAAKVAYKRLRK